MDRAEAIRQLPGTYARALTLRDQGCGHLTIADDLGIPPQAIQILLQLADAKLASLLKQHPD